MLTLAPCPHCASRVPDDGAFCDTCGRALAFCPTCQEFVRPGERCVAHGVAGVARTPARQHGSPAVANPVATPVAPVTAPTVAPPPRRGARAVPAGGGIAAAAPNAGGAAGGSGGQLGGAPGVAALAASAAAPSHAAQGTTVRPLARKLRLVAAGGVSLPPLEVAPDTIVGRGEGPFAVLLDPFHDKGLSRRHCQFRRGATGAWSIVDLAGRNSTFVSTDGTWSGPSIAQNASCPVEPGRDQIRLGLLTFAVEAIA